MSMHQPDDYSDVDPAADPPKWPKYKSASQQASFGRALSNIGLLYGHINTMMMKVCSTPEGGDPVRMYERRGWTYLEKRLADTVAPRTHSLDISAWPKAEKGRETMQEHKAQDGDPVNLNGVKDPTPEQMGPITMSEDEKVLVAQADHSGMSVSFMGTLGVLCGANGRGAPVAVSHFGQELRATRVFTMENDFTICEEVYASVAVPMLENIVELDFTNLCDGWGAVDWKHLGGTLDSAKKLKKLAIVTDPKHNESSAMVRTSGESEGLTDENAVLFFGEMVKGTAPWLKELNMLHCKMGSAGRCAFIEAKKRGAMPALRSVLATTPQGAEKDKGEGKVLMDAIKAGHFKNIHELNLGVDLNEKQSERFMDLVPKKAPAMRETWVKHPSEDAQDAHREMLIELQKKRLDGAHLAKHFKQDTQLGCHMSPDYMREDSEWRDPLPWGDDEIVQFAAAIADATKAGALKKVKFLRLDGLQLGDEAYNALAAALRDGALPALQRIECEGRTAAAYAAKAACKKIDAEMKAILKSKGVQFDEEPVRASA